MGTKFLRDRSGVSATEFAVIAPVLALMVLGMLDGWSYAASMLAMRAAVKAGANYVIEGGGTSDTARAVAVSAWVSPPSDASVAVTQACYCSGAATTCGLLCVGTAKAPSAYLTVRATGTWTPPAPFSYVLEARTVVHSEVIRVR
jgi:Flp pilus assembly protein TadG